MFEDYLAVNANVYLADDLEIAKRWEMKKKVLRNANAILKINSHNITENLCTVALHLRRP